MVHGTRRPGFEYKLQDFFVKESRSFGSNNETHWGLHSTVDSDLVSHPAVPGSIRGVPKFFQ